MAEDKCQHKHRASNGWSDVTNCEIDHGYYKTETESERQKVDNHNLRLQEQAYAMEERQDYCLDCGQHLNRPEHDCVKLAVSESGLKYWRV